MINIERKTYSLEQDIACLNDSKSLIFLQGNGLNGEHYYYLINFKDKKITCWSIDISQIKADIKKLVEEKYKVKWAGYSLNFLDFSLMAHTAIYHKGNIYVTSINSNYIICLSIYDNSYKIISDKNALHKLLSSTNSIHGNEIYFTRYDIYDKIKNLNYEKENIENEICRYNIDTGKFTKINSFNNPVTMHQTAITPDAENVISVGICTAPKVRFPRNINYLNDKEFMVNILNQGLQDSHLVNYNMTKRSYSGFKTNDCIAHLEFDVCNPHIVYISSHNLGFNGGGFGNDIYSFGPGAIYKFNYKSNEILGKYSAEDFIRLTCHQPFKYYDKNLIAVTVFPSQIHLIDTDTMEIYKKIYVSNSNICVDFSKGPYYFPKMGKTPYTVLCNNDSPYIFYGGLTGLKVYDFIKEKIMGTINYNVNRMPLSALGHPIIFEED
jgi:hypothetical protein